MSNCKNILIGVFAVSNIRNFLEIGLQGGILISPDAPLNTFVMYFLHYTLFYYMIFAALSLMLYGFARKHIKLSEAYTVGASAICLVCLAPIIDSILLGRIDIAYPVNPWNVVCNLHHFWDFGYDYHGLSFGMRIEITLASLAAMVYLYIKTKRIAKSVICGVCVSVVCLAFGLMVPTLAQLYDNGLNFADDYNLRFSTLLQGGCVLKTSSDKISVLYILLCVLLFAVGYFIRNRRYFVSVIKNFRITRAVHYLLLFFAGVAFIYYNPPVENPLYEDFEFLKDFGHPFDIIGVAMAAAAIFLSFESAVIFNDIYDYNVDCVSNPNRPLVTKTIPFDEFKLMGGVFLVLALMIAISINPTFFMLVLVYNLAAFLYSAPPVRLRKYIGVSNLLLAFIFLLTFYAGTTVIIPNFMLANVPSHISIGLLVCFFLALTIKDIKDTKGDKADNIQTLSTVMSPKAGNIVTVACVCCSILLSPWLFQQSHLYVFAVVVLIAFLLGVKLIPNPKIKEAYVTGLYYLYVVVLMGSVIW